MSINAIQKKLRLPNVLVLLSIIFLSCALLIFINYFTIKILSASRAYINGESHYSKGQKDAARHLITYVYSEDIAQWKLFQEQLSVPKGDGVARVGLTNNQEVETIKKGLKDGQNHEEDLDDMIWLFQNFNNIPFFKKAIGEWEQGDTLIKQLDSIGNEIHSIIQNKQLNDQSKAQFLAKISDLSDKLSVNERNFSNTLGEGTREIKDYLIYINMLFILIIICSVTLYFSAMMKKLMLSKNEIESKNNDLLLVNKELDKFVYSVSHDLRSPITSLKGLVEILKDEEDPEQSLDYLKMMTQILNKQDNFIRDIIDYSKNNRSQIVIEAINVNDLFTDVISQLQYIEGARAITINKEVAIEQIHTDPFRLKIILNNLLSNAIKYADLDKNNPFIKVKAYNLEESSVIEIEDNGIGINPEYQERIFEMFFVTSNDNKGTGLGLYIVKDAIENIKGSIEVESEINVGTKFIVNIPHHTMAN